LIQIQSDRFLFNWRSMAESDEYPRYPTIRDAFLWAWGEWTAFIDVESLGEISVSAIEMSYINAIAKGKGWQNWDSVGEIFPDFAWRKAAGRYLPGPEKVVYVAAIQMGDEGSLTIRVNPANLRTDGAEIIRFELTAQKQVREPNADFDIRTWLGIAHEWIVRGFADLTADEVQKKTWLRLDDDN
jgi:uncharacterized protein (TIGR04255 family)